MPTTMARRVVVLGIRFRGRIATPWASQSNVRSGDFDGWLGNETRFRGDGGDWRWNGARGRVRAGGNYGQAHDERIEKTRTGCFGN